jgi:DNA-directed RNA polymerase subunit RPC12/RpoP
MANEMRDRLVELMTEADAKCRNTVFCNECSAYGKGRDCIDYNLADFLIENGVIVRKRAKWIYTTDCYRCSVCAGKRFNLLLGTDAEYCPYCGAKMVFDNQAEQKLKEMRGE